MGSELYVKSAFKYQKSDLLEPGGPGGIARFAGDIGGTVANIKALGCTGVIIGFDDIDSPDPVDFEFIECVEAGEMDLGISVWHAPPSFASVESFWSNGWHHGRAFDVSTFVATQIQPRFKRKVRIIGDCEFYAAKHPYRKDAAGTMVKDLPWTPHVVESLGMILPQNVYDEVWPIGKQHADAVGYKFHMLAPACIDWDERFDASGGAFQDQGLTIPANPPPNAYPGYFPATKPRRKARWCSSTGTHVKAGSIYRKLWLVKDCKDGVCYVDDRDIAAVLA